MHGKGIGNAYAVTSRTYNAYAHAQYHSMLGDIDKPLTFEKGVLNMIEQNDCQENCSQKESYSSGDF